MPQPITEDDLRKSEEQHAAEVLTEDDHSGGDGYFFLRGVILDCDEWDLDAQATTAAHDYLISDPGPNGCGGCECCCQTQADGCNDAARDSERHVVSYFPHWQFLLAIEE